MRRPALGVVVVALWILAGGAAWGQSIELYFGADCDSTCGTVPANGFGTLYINVILAGPAAGGISGAEFRVVGFPPGWFAICTPNPAIGNILGWPLDEAGGIAFSAPCSGAASSCLNLFTCRVFAVSEVHDRVLSVERRLPGCCPGSPCPLVWLCDAPAFTRLCVTGGQAILNPSSGCEVAVERRTWSTVKRLYD